MKKGIILAIGFILGVCGPAFPMPVQWDISDGGNGHWYQVVENTDPHGVWTWNDANDFASSASHNGMQGHLATITSEAENDFVSSKAFLGSVHGGLFAKTIWLGGFQDTDATGLEDGWHWVTGETWGVTDWRSGQPDNSSHNFLAMAAGSISPGSGWYDMPDNGKFWRDINTAYIIEYEPASVPIPGSALLLVSGLCFIFRLRRI